MANIIEWFVSIPTFTQRYGLLLFLVSILLATNFITGREFIIDYQFTLHQFQIWRFLTNFFLIGDISFFTIFFILLFLIILKKHENVAISRKKYGEFLMMIVLILIDCIRDPEDETNLINNFQIKSIKSNKIDKYLPFVMIMISICIDAHYCVFIGYAVGFIYYLLKYSTPIYCRLNLLVTPKFLDYLDNPVYKGFFTLNNQNYSGGNNSSVIRSSIEYNPASYSAFSGKGHSWGNIDSSKKD